MSLDNKPIYTGGCQCGAVRFRIEGALNGVSICHCRMCQKAFGAYYAPLVDVKPELVEWTRGAPALFQSSSIGQRGFCNRCGTPLCYEAADGIALSAGAFDNPTTLSPTVAWGAEGKLPFVDGIPSIPSKQSDEDENFAEHLHGMVSYQHPDHDTDDSWTPEKN